MPPNSARLGNIETDAEIYKVAWLTVLCPARNGLDVSSSKRMLKCLFAKH